MDVRSGFQRNYFIFVNEDAGYEAGQKPSGHLKIEVREGRGRLNTAVQNLRPGNGRFDYSLYLIGSAGMAKTMVYAGNLESRPGKAELEWIFDPADVGGSGVAIEGFDVFAVIAEGAAGRENNPACPLAAYRGKRVEWKNDFRTTRMVKKPLQPEIKPLPKFEAKPEIKPLPKKEIQPAQPQPAEAGLQPVPVVKTEQAAAPLEQPQTAEPLQTIDQGQLYQAGQPTIGDEAQLYQYGPIQQTGQFSGAGQGQQYDQSPASQNGQSQAYIPYQFYQEQPISAYDPYQTYQQPVQTYDPFQTFSGQSAEPVQYPGEFTQQPAEAAQMMQPAEAAPLQPDIEAEQMQQPEILKQEQPDAGFMPEVPEMVQSDEMQPPQDTSKQQVGSEQAQPSPDTYKEPKVIEPAQEQAVPQSEYQYPVGSGNLDTGCLYLNGNICGAILNTMPETASPCDTCKIHRGEPAGQVEAAGDLSRFKAILDLNFEASDPFHSKRSDYEWWKITNPVNLNNILYQNNIRSPLMFNPAVMLAHYKYHHLIVGIFTRKDRQKYVVCGVPGMHMVDRKPFGDMSKWVQADGGRSRYGAFGYWLVYINPDDGKILNLNQE